MCSQVYKIAVQQVAATMPQAWYKGQLKTGQQEFSLP